MEKTSHTHTEKTAVRPASSASGVPSPNANPKSGLGWSLAGLALVALLYIAYFMARGRIDLTGLWPRVVFYVVGGLACICFGMGIGHSVKILRRARRR